MITLSEQNAKSESVISFVTKIPKVARVVI